MAQRSKDREGRKQQGFAIPQLDPKTMEKFDDRSFQNWG
jgi:hypothetical protein